MRAVHFWVSVHPHTHVPVHPNPEQEEQEKARKAIETELRKLQSAVGEICVAFDQKLADLFIDKLAKDHEIMKNELFAISLKLALHECKGHDGREEGLLRRLEELRGLKANYVADLPQVRRQWDQCKEAQDLCARKDRDLEKAFKKEFHAYEALFAQLLVLFRRRDVGVE
jgi:hypothetical protein